MNITIIKAFGDFLDQHVEVLANLQKKAQQYDMHGALSEEFIEQEILPIARVNGFEITVGDLKQCENHILTQKGNLSLEELESVAGGVGTRFISAGMLSLMMISNFANLQPASAMMGSGSFGNSAPSTSQTAQIAEDVKNVDINFTDNDGLEYRLVEDDVVNVIRFDGERTAPTLTIPGAIRTPDGKTYRVGALEDKCFQNAANLQKVVLSEGIEQISTCAFENSSLKEIVIPGSVKTIENSAFRKCYNLTEITILSGVTTIGDYAFSGCKKLRNIIIPDGVTTIGDYAFINCIGLEKITMPDSIETIGEYAFNFCRKLQSITIPSGVTTIKDGTFSVCTALREITIPENVTTIGPKAFNHCSDLEVMDIINETAIIDELAFCDVSRFARIRINQPIENVLDMFFIDCKANIYGRQYDKRNNKYVWVEDIYRQERTASDQQHR